MFNTFTTESFSAPVEKLVALNLSIFNKTVEAQTQAVKSLVELTDTRVKAMTAIKTTEGLTTFVKEQNELAKSTFTKAVTDSKDAAEQVKAYNEEVAQIISESVKAPAKKAA